MRASFTPAASPTGPASLGTVKSTGDYQNEPSPLRWFWWGPLPGMSGPPLPRALACPSRAPRKGCARHPNVAHTPSPPRGGDRNGSTLDGPAHRGAEGARKRLLGVAGAATGLGLLV